MNFKNKNKTEMKRITFFFAALLVLLTSFGLKAQTRDPLLKVTSITAAWNSASQTYGLAYTGLQGTNGKTVLLSIDYSTTLNTNNAVKDIPNQQLPLGLSSAQITLNNGQLFQNLTVPGTIQDSVTLKYANAPGDTIYNRVPLTVQLTNTTTEPTATWLLQNRTMCAGLNEYTDFTLTGLPPFTVYYKVGTGATQTYTDVYTLATTLPGFQSAQRLGVESLRTDKDGTFTFTIDSVRDLTGRLTVLAPAAKTKTVVVEQLPNITWPATSASICAFPFTTVNDSTAIIVKAGIRSYTINYTYTYNGKTYGPLTVTRTTATATDTIKYLPITLDSVASDPAKKIVFTINADTNATALACTGDVPAPRSLNANFRQSNSSFSIAGIDTVCNLDVKTYSVTGSNLASSPYTWTVTPAANATFSATAGKTAASATPEITWKSANALTVPALSVMFRDNNGCTYKLDTTVAIYPKPRFTVAVTAQADTTLICSGSGVPLRITTLAGTTWYAKMFPLVLSYKIGTTDYTDTIKTLAGPTYTVITKPVGAAANFTISGFKLKSAIGCDTTSSPSTVKFTGTTQPSPVITALGNFKACNTYNAPINNPFVLITSEAKQTAPPALLDSSLTVRYSVYKASDMSLLGTGSQILVQAVDTLRFTPALGNNSLITEPIVLRIDTVKRNFGNQCLTAYTTYTEGVNQKTMVPYTLNAHLAFTDTICFGSGNETVKVNIDGPATSRYNFVYNFIDNGVVTQLMVLDTTQTFNLTIPAGLLINPASKYEVQASAMRDLSVFGCRNDFTAAPNFDTNRINVTPRTLPTVNSIANVSAVAVCQGSKITFDANVNLGTKGAQTIYYSICKVGATVSSDTIRGTKVMNTDTIGMNLDFIGIDFTGQIGGKNNYYVDSIKDAHGCKSTGLPVSIFTLQVDTVPTIAFGRDTICKNSSVFPLVITPAIKLPVGQNFEVSYSLGIVGDPGYVSGNHTSIDTGGVQTFPLYTTLTDKILVTIDSIKITGSTTQCATKYLPYGTLQKWIVATEPVKPAIVAITKIDTICNGGNALFVLTTPVGKKYAYTNPTLTNKGYTVTNRTKVADKAIKDSLYVNWATPTVFAGGNDTIAISYYDSTTTNCVGTILVPVYVRPAVSITSLNAAPLAICSGTPFDLTVITNSALQAPVKIYYKDTTTALGVGSKNWDAISTSTNYVFNGLLANVPAGKGTDADIKSVFVIDSIVDRTGCPVIGTTKNSTGVAIVKAPQMTVISMPTATFAANNIKPCPGVAYTDTILLYTRNNVYTLNYSIAGDVTSQNGNKTSSNAVATTNLTSDLPLKIKVPMLPIPEGKTVTTTLKSILYTDALTGLTCSATLTEPRVVTVDNLVVDTIKGPDALCALAIANYTLKPGTGPYTWQFQGATESLVTNNNTATVSWKEQAAGQTYRITATYGSLGCQKTVTKDVTVNPIPAISAFTLTNVDGCKGSQMEWNITMLKGTAPFYITHYDSILPAKTKTASITDTITAANMVAPNVYKKLINRNVNDTTVVTLTTITDANGCSQSIAPALRVKYNVDQLNAKFIPSKPICANEPFKLGFVTKGGRKPYTLTYSYVDASNVTHVIPVNGGANLTSDTVYTQDIMGITVPTTFKIVEVKDGLCTYTNTDTLRLIVNPLPIPTITGQNLVCQSAAGVKYTTEKGKADYTWTVKSGVASTVAGVANLDSVKINFGSTLTGVQAIDTLLVSYRDAAGCVGTTTKLITIQAKPTITSIKYAGTAAQPVCGFSVVDMKVSGFNTTGTWNVTYQVEDSLGVVAKTATVNNIAIANIADTYTIKDTVLNTKTVFRVIGVTNGLGCTAATNVADTVKVLRAPQVSYIGLTNNFIVGCDTLKFKTVVDGKVTCKEGLTSKIKVQVLPAAVGKFDLQMNFRNGGWVSLPFNATTGIATLPTNIVVNTIDTIPTRFVNTNPDRVYTATPFAVSLTDAATATQVWSNVNALNTLTGYLTPAAKTTLITSPLANSNVIVRCAGDSTTVSVLGNCHIGSMAQVAIKIPAMAVNKMSLEYFDKSDTMWKTGNIISDTLTYWGGPGRKGFTMDSSFTMPIRFVSNTTTATPQFNVMAYVVDTLTKTQVYSDTLKFKANVVAAVNPGFIALGLDGATINCSAPFTGTAKIVTGCLQGMDTTVFFKTNYPGYMLIKYIDKDTVTRTLNIASNGIASIKLNTLTDSLNVDTIKFNYEVYTTNPDALAVTATLDVSAVSSFAAYDRATITLDRAPYHMANQSVITCANSGSVNLTNLYPTTGNSRIVTWLGANKLPLAQAPTMVSTATPGTFVYYVYNTLTGTGCVSDTATVTLKVKAPATVTMHNLAYCHNELAPKFGFTGTASFYEWKWVSGSDTLGLSVKQGKDTIPAFTAKNVGNVVTIANYTVTPVDTTNGMRCEGAPVNFQIAVNPRPVIAHYAVDTLCNGTPVSPATFASSVTQANYSWRSLDTLIKVGVPNSGTGNINQFTPSNATVAPITAKYELSATYTYDNKTCQEIKKDTFSITVNPTPAVTNVTNFTTCKKAGFGGQTFQGNATKYVWSFTSGTNIFTTTTGTGSLPAVSSTSLVAGTGNYTVTPYYGNCAGKTESFTITVPGTPVVSPIPAVPAVCGSGALLLTEPGITANGATIIKQGWMLNNVDYTPGTIVDVNANGKVLVYKVITACDSVTSQTTIVVNATPSVTNVKNFELCSGETFAGYTFQGTGTFTWNYVSGQNFYGTTSGAILGSFSKVNNGTSPLVGNYTVVSTTGTGCTSTAANFTITVKPAATLGTLATPAPICGSGNVVLTAPTVNNNGVNVQKQGWIVNGTTFYAANAAISAVNGDKIVYMLKTDCDSVVSNEVTVTVNAAPTMPTYANIEACSGQSTTPPAFGTTGTTWTFVSGVNVFTTNSGTGDLPAFTKVNNGTTDMTGNYLVTVSTAGTCSASQTFTITVNQAIQISGTVNNVSAYGLSNGAISIDVAGGKGTNTYTWTGTSAITEDVTGLAAGTYTVTVTNDCGSASKTFTVTQPAPSNDANLVNYSVNSVNYTGDVTLIRLSCESRVNAAPVHITLPVGATCTIPVDTTIDVTKAGVYTLNFTITAQDGVTKKNYSIKLEQRLLKETIIVKFDGKAIGFNNNSATNGGYTAEGNGNYQWYKDNNAIANATNQVYNAMQSAGEYYTTVVIKGQTIATCPITIGSTKVSTLKVYPTSVKGGQTVNVDVNQAEADASMNNMTVQVYNTRGQLFATLPATTSMTQVAMPTTPGIYIVKVTADGFEKSVKVVVE